MDYLHDHAIITCFVEDETSYLVFNAWIMYLNQRVWGGNMVFSHAYVITHKYFGKKTKDAKNEYINFYIQLNMFSCIFFQHLGPQILSLVNTKNQPNGKKNSLNSLLPF
jgi:hypothetical protein